MQSLEWVDLSLEEKESLLCNTLLTSEGLGFTSPWLAIGSFSWNLVSPGIGETSGVWLPLSFLATILIILSGR